MIAAGTMIAVGTAIAAGAVTAAGTTIVAAGADPIGAAQIMAGATRAAGPNGAGTTGCASAVELQDRGGAFGRRPIPLARRSAVLLIMG